MWLIGSTPSKLAVLRAVVEHRPLVGQRGVHDGLVDRAFLRRWVIGQQGRGSDGRGREGGAAEFQEITPAKASVILSPFSGV